VTEWQQLALLVTPLAAVTHSGLRCQVKDRRKVTVLGGGALLVGTAGAAGAAKRSSKSANGNNFNSKEKTSEDRAETWAASFTRRWHSLLGLSPLSAVHPEKNYRRLVDDSSVREIAMLINDVVDMAGFIDAEEQEIFETATILVLDEIAGILPKTYVDMIRGNRKGEHHRFSRKDVEYLEARLNLFAREHVRLPFLSSDDSKNVKRCVVHILVSAMVEQQGVKHILKEHKRAIILEVFMKSTISQFVEPEERNRCVSEIVDHIKDIPFVPSPVIHKVVGICFAMVGEIIAVSLNEALDEYTRVRQTGEEASIYSDWEGDTDRAKMLSFLAAVPLLKSLSDNERWQVLQAMKMKYCEQGEHVIRSGEIGSEFYIVEQGFLSALVDGHPVSYYGPGSYFGELSILHSQRRAADVVATSPDVKLLCLDQQAFKATLGEAQKLLLQLPPPAYPQSEFVGYLRLGLYERLLGNMPSVLNFALRGVVLALVDDILVRVKAERLQKAVSTFFANHEDLIHIDDEEPGVGKATSA